MATNRRPGRPARRPRLAAPQQGTKARPGLEEQGLGRTFRNTQRLSDLVVLEAFHVVQQEGPSVARRQLGDGPFEVQPVQRRSARHGPAAGVSNASKSSTASVILWRRPCLLLTKSRQAFTASRCSHVPSAASPR